MAEGIREVHLSSELCQAVEQRYAAHFGSLDKFLEHILQKLVSDNAAQMDQNEQRIIEERLKNLGYV